MKRWLIAHLDNPYVDLITRRILAEKLEITELQVSGWFHNARQRKWFKDIYSKHKLFSATSVDFLKIKKKIIDHK